MSSENRSDCVERLERSPRKRIYPATVFPTVFDRVTTTAMIRIDRTIFRRTNVFTGRHHRAHVSNEVTSATPGRSSKSQNGVGTIDLRLLDATVPGYQLAELFSPIAGARNTIPKLSRYRRGSLGLEIPVRRLGA